MMTNRLLGAWSLEKVHAKDENGRILYPLGIKPKGLLTYTENKMSGSGELSEELLNDKNYSLKPFFYYSGYYEIKDNIIIHYVELSNQIEWKNRKLIRYFKFINSSTVEIKSEEVLGSTKYTMIFTWVRC